MKKIIKRALISIGILVGVFILMLLVFGYKFFKETKKMTPAETSRINDSVFCIKDKYVNAFIFKGANSFLMVDAGISDASFKAELDKLGIAPEKITTILLTHTDGDHIGAMGLCKDAKVYMHKDEEQMVNGMKAKKPYMPKSIWKYQPYQLLNSNDTLSIDGISIKIIHTPGHTPGSSCYMIHGTYLVAGDNVAYVNGKFQHFNDLFNNNTAQQDSSIKNLRELNTAKFVLTGHYGVIKN
jgi:glyoxylase-like metal-dependent hydrolase (beta-lactamase superfamily II)